MTTPTGNDTTGAALLALLILLAMRGIDYVLPKGWHLKLIRRWAERDGTGAGDDPPEHY